MPTAGGGGSWGEWSRKLSHGWGGGRYLSHLVKRSQWRQVRGSSGAEVESIVPPRLENLFFQSCGMSEITATTLLSNWEELYTTTKYKNWHFVVKINWHIILFTGPLYIYIYTCCFLKPQFGTELTFLHLQCCALHFDIGNAHMWLIIHICGSGVNGRVADITTYYDIILCTKLTHTSH